jgi:hypothetical protein
MVSLQVVLLSAPTSLASTMVIVPHHAAVTHAGYSSEVRSGPAEAHVSAGYIHRKSWSEFCVLVTTSPRRVKWVCVPRGMRSVVGRHPSADPRRRWCPAGGPVAGAQSSKVIANQVGSVIPRVVNDNLAGYWI